ncbi:hypothetical protein NA397_23340, partial [Salmonella sp. NW638]|nr:hypothetical protein [Salmonella enterica]MCQ7682265.1 hypothetical protein [Salmonella enterica]MCQ7747363.1 hypothetical protein [Salmonella enterica]MCQ7796721.1 hypothetical protein [Salmonella enterica]MCQ7814881.1 hypothetical protein [Salmonella enterica]
EWVHVQLHQQKGMISLSPPTICNSAGKFTILIVLTYQRCMLTAGIFPLTVFCKNGDITNPELSGGKMPDAGRNMTWDLRAPAPTPSHLRATVAIKGSFRGAEF